MVFRRCGAQTSNTEWEKDGTLDLESREESKSGSIMHAIGSLIGDEARGSIRTMTQFSMAACIFVTSLVKKVPSSDVPHCANGAASGLSAGLMEKR
jgi:hypothetical protein